MTKALGGVQVARQKAREVADNVTPASLTHVPSTALDAGHVSLRLPSARYLNSLPKFFDSLRAS